MSSKVSLVTFLDPGSVAIVIGGSISAALISFPLKNVMGTAKVIKNAFFSKPLNAGGLIADLVSYAEKARRDGILSLEDMTRDMEDEFIVRGVQMVVDGTDPELIEQIMDAEIETMCERHASGKALFDALGKYAPSFGMIGTLIGLVVMLNNMDDPSAIGPGMAVALLTTLYGALLANLVALPIADKLGRRSQEEMLRKSIILRGIMSIQSGDNPRIVEHKLLTFLPPSFRAEKDKEAAA
jgi:chemotaxis protein MotA